MQEAGREIHPDDMPPALEWEQAAWDLFELVGTQWRIGGMGQLVGLDYNPALALMQATGWDVVLGIELLGAIEREYLRRAEK